MISPKRLCCSWPQRRSYSFKRVIYRELDCSSLAQRTFSKSSDDLIVYICDQLGLITAVWSYRRKLHIWAPCLIFLDFFSSKKYCFDFLLMEDNSLFFAFCWRMHNFLFCEQMKESWPQSLIYFFHDWSFQFRAAIFLFGFSMIIIIPFCWQKRQGRFERGVETADFI